MVSHSAIKKINIIKNSGTPLMASKPNLTHSVPKIKSNKDELKMGGLKKPKVSKVIKQQKVTTEDVINAAAQSIINMGYIGRPISLGCSGGNASDLIRNPNFCSTGTLGFLVQNANKVQYIVSCSHVFVGNDPTETSIDQTQIGDVIAQPGAVDMNCSPSNIKYGVANLSGWVSLNQNTPASETDVAVAKVIHGTVTTNGNIIGIGQPLSITANSASNPTINEPIIKSGRTTGVTSGSIVYINIAVQVQYDKPDGTTFNIVYNGCFAGIGKHGSFSGAGDSGSLILKSNNTPVGILFAGNSEYTIGFPIGRVLSRINSLLNSTVTLVGRGTTTNTTVHNGKINLIHHDPVIMRDAHGEPHLEEKAPTIINRGHNEVRIKQLSMVKDNHLDVIGGIHHCVGIGIHYDEISQNHGIVLFVHDPDRKEVQNIPTELTEQNLKIVYLSDKIKAN